MKKKQLFCINDYGECFQFNNQTSAMSRPEVSNQGRVTCRVLLSLFYRCSVICCDHIGKLPDIAQRKGWMLRAALSTSLPLAWLKCTFGDIY